MRTLSRPVATRTAPACTPDDRTRLRSTAPAPVPRAIRLLRAHESETSDGIPVILGRAPIRRTNPPVAGSQGSRTHATASDSRICICVPFRPPTLYPPPAALLTISRPCPPSGRSQIAATHDVNAPSAFALAFTFTSRRTTHSPHAPPFLERAKPEARARLRTGVPASRTRTLYSIPRQQMDARTRRTARALDPSFLPLRLPSACFSSRPRQSPRADTHQPSQQPAVTLARLARQLVTWPWRPTWLGEVRASACIIDISRKPRLHPIIRIPSPSLDGDEREGCVGPARACEMHGARRAGGTASVPCSPNRPPALPYPFHPLNLQTVTALGALPMLARRPVLGVSAIDRPAISRTPCAHSPPI